MSRTPWPKVKLGEICNIFTGKKDVNQTVANGPYRFFSCAPTLFYSNEYIFDGAAIIVAGNGSYTGRVTYYEGKFDLYQRTYACTITKPHLADIKFVYDVMRLRFQKEIRGSLKGASIPYIVKGHLSDFEISLPPLPVQRRIADILSAYDDLIENNRRRIAILEETARLTYRKWFGGGEGRSLPLAEVADVLYGKDHKKIPNGDIPIFGSGGIMRYGAKAIYEQPSVLIPRKGTISNVMYVEEPFWTVDTMFYTRVKIPNMERILYYQLCDYNIASMSTGAAVPSMTTAILNSLQIVVPPSELRQRFDKAVSPMFEQCRVLKKQSAALAASRDMLLPRLMKGDWM